MYLCNGYCICLYFEITVGLLLLLFITYIRLVSQLNYAGLLYVQSYYQGMAAIRIVRIVRFLWFFKLYKQTKTDKKKDSVVDSVRNYKSKFFKAFAELCSIAVVRLERIWNELFSTHSHGALVVLGMFFFTVYVFSATMWNTTGKKLMITPQGSAPWGTSGDGGNGGTSQCDTFERCFYVLLRLSFYVSWYFIFIMSSLHHYWVAPFFDFCCRPFFYQRLVVQLSITVYYYSITSKNMNMFWK